MSRVHPLDPLERALDAAFNEGTVLAAVSGGPDSMAMFHALCMLAGQRDDLHVVAAHLDHRLRPGSEGDIDAVRSVASRFGARVIDDRVDVKAHARATRQSFEAAARELRYAFLERAADEAGADWIATAHTREDQHETIVMRMLRGAGDRGLRGIHERRGRIVRPLLSVTHKQTVQHCFDHRVPYVLDPSNIDRRYLRNHIRMDVMPSLRRAYMDLDTTLDRVSASARARFDDAARGVAVGLECLRVERDGWSLPLTAFQGLDADSHTYLLMGALRAMGSDDGVTSRHFTGMRRMIDGPSGRSIDLPRLRMRREHDALFFTPRDLAREPGAATCTLDIPGEAVLDGWRIVAERVSDRCVGSPFVVYLGADAPLTVRFPRTGDRMQPFGMSGHKKLSDLFIDMKIPRRIRVETPVIESSGEILWVVGVAASELTRIDEAGESVIRVTATRRDP